MVDGIDHKGRESTRHTKPCLDYSTALKGEKHSKKRSNESREIPSQDQSNIGENMYSRNLHCCECERESEVIRIF